MVVFQRPASASPAPAQLAITAAHEGALALIVRQQPPPVPSQTFGFSHTSPPPVPQVQTPQTFGQMSRRFAPAAPPLASTHVPHLLPLAPSARVFFDPSVTVDTSNLPASISPGMMSSLRRQGSSHDKYNAKYWIPASAGMTAKRAAGAVEKKAEETFSQGAVADVFVHQEVPVSSDEKPHLVSKNFAEFELETTALLQAQTERELPEIEKLKLDRAQRAVVIVQALRADAQTFKNGLSQLFFMTAQRVETNPILADIVRKDPTSDIVIRAHAQMEPVYRALNVLSDFASAKEGHTPDLNQLKQAIQTLGLDKAFQREIQNVLSAQVLPKPDFRRFIVNELFDGAKRDGFYAIVDTLVLRAIQERYPELDMTDTREVLGRWGRKFGEPKAEEPNDNDVLAVEDAGASASASDHGAGNSGTGQ